MPQPSIRDPAVDSFEIRICGLLEDATPRRAAHIVRIDGHRSDEVAAVVTTEPGRS